MTSTPTDPPLRLKSQSELLWQGVEDRGRSMHERVNRALGYAPNGRFLTNTRVDTGPPVINLITNWPAGCPPFV